MHDSRSFFLLQLERDATKKTLLDVVHEMDVLEE